MISQKKKDGIFQPPANQEGSGWQLQQFHPVSNRTTGKPPFVVSEIENGLIWSPSKHSSPSTTSLRARVRRRPSTPSRPISVNETGILLYRFISSHRRVWCVQLHTSSQRGKKILTAEPRHQPTHTRRKPHTMSTARAAARALVKAGSRRAPSTAASASTGGAQAGGGTAAGVGKRGVASAVGFHQNHQNHQHHQQERFYQQHGFAIVAGSAFTLLSLSLALSEPESVEDILPSFLLEKLHHHQQEGRSSPAAAPAFARIEEVRIGKVRGSRCEHTYDIVRTTSLHSDSSIKTEAEKNVCFCGMAGGG